ncbi:MAG: Asr1405/Asl0597 family protein [Leptolyngbyaceae cyanobacterium]
MHSIQTSTCQTSTRQFFVRQSFARGAHAQQAAAPQSSRQFSEITQINSVDRWSMYHRLQELAIPCSCVTGQPLKVQVDNPAIALQLWGVAKQFNAPRQDKIAWLNNCWQQQESNTQR